MRIDFRHLAIALALLLGSNIAARASESAPLNNAAVELTAKIDECALAGVTCIRLSAVNLSNSQSVIVQGDRARLASPSGNIEAANQRAVYKMLAKKNVEKKREAQLAASIATAGLATMIVSDAIDKRRGKQEWLGDEAKRRQSTDSLFEERIVLPLDHTEGLLYFVGFASESLRLRVVTKQWPPEEGQSSDVYQFVEIPVQARK